MTTGFRVVDDKCLLVSELSLISLHWFLTAFASVVHMKVLLRIWDLFFYEGSVVLFQVTLGMLKMKVRQCTCSYWYKGIDYKFPCSHNKDCTSIVIMIDVNHVTIRPADFFNI